MHPKIYLPIEDWNSIKSYRLIDNTWWLRYWNRKHNKNNANFGSSSNGKYEHEKLLKICRLKLKLTQIHNLWKSICQSIQFSNQMGWIFLFSNFLFFDFFFAEFNSKKSLCATKKNYASMVNDEYSIIKCGSFNRNATSASVCMRIVLVLTVKWVHYAVDGWSDMKSIANDTHKIKISVLFCYKCHLISFWTYSSDSYKRLFVLKILDNTKTDFILHFFHKNVLNLRRTLMQIKW